MSMTKEIYQAYLKGFDGDLDYVLRDLNRTILKRKLKRNRENFRKRLDTYNKEKERKKK